MSKIDRNYVNFSQDHELNHWLQKKGYRETQDNRSILTEIITNEIKPHFGLNSSQNLKWVQLDSYHSDFPLSFLELEQKN